MRYWLALFIALLPLAPVSGQQTSLRVDVRLVNVFATVTDAAGKYVGGLTKDDFILEEDGVRQEIAHFSQDDQVPVSVGILFDSSGSMENKLRTAVTAVDRFIRTIHPDDDIFLMTFSGRTELRQDFTGDRDTLSKALRAILASGATSLYDSLEQGMDKIKAGRHEKRAILLISDGEDTDSKTSFETVLEQLRGSEVLVYPVGISPTIYAKASEHVPFTWPPPLPGSVRGGVAKRRDAVDFKVLQTLADQSGGRAYLLTDSLLSNTSQIDKMLTQVAEELRSQYTLAFYPAHPDDGRFHRLRVRTAGGLLVRARPGYSAR
jgi:Ca-activated chloride channel family protein